MSPLVTRPASPAAELRLERAARTARGRGVAVRLAGWREPAVVFGAAYLVYAAVGLYATLGLDLVVGDAESRLAHAFFVWWNEPSKLTAIGFYWPPLQTLVLLPLAAVPPLATSLAALPLTSAVFGAGLLVVLDRTLAAAELDRPLRWALLAAFGLNPLIAFYAGNGMAEIVYLFFLTLGLSVVVRWSREPRWQALPIAGFAFGLGTLARYEVGIWLAIAVVAALAVMIRARQSIPAIEAAFLVLLVPAVYGLVTWAFVNWSLTGDPLGFLSGQLVPKEGQQTNASLLELAARTGLVQLAIFPAAALVGVAVLVVGIRRRSPIGIALAAATALGGLLTFVFVLRQQQDFLLQLRYNMRAMPIAMVGIAWLLAMLPAARRRLAALAALAVLVGSGFSTGVTMLAFPHALGEEAFLRGVLTGSVQDGVSPPGGTGVSIDDQREMAAYIRAHAPGSNVILTDDARNYGVMLVDGRPDRYVDRIDFGDPAWLRLLERPRPSIRFFLVERGATRARDPVFFDRIVDRFPALGTGERPPRFLELVHENASYALYRVVAPTRTLSSSSTATTSAPSSARMPSSAEASPSTPSRNRRTTSSLP